MPARRTARLLPLLVMILLPASSRPQGTVHLVLGSDTGIWEGMDVSKYNCTYLPGLFTDPSRNAYRVMDPSFRLGLRDSYGTPVKLTWWIMAGNLFRYATNTDVPLPSTMVFHLFRRHHAGSMRMWGDEVTLHFHTFHWSDYNADGRWYWNQARSFAESRADFDRTLAEVILEEEILPVSFRSGWHAMDNVWQRRLDEVLPYSLHNDWPAVRRDTTEPIDNVYDWSRAPSTFVPFRPSPDDYQRPGNGRGWNVRSVFMSEADSAFMERVFAEASRGIDQVVCIWAHLPETDFLENIRFVNSSAHAVAPRWPNVRFRYSTAVEAMQAWRRCADTTRPAVTMEEWGDSASVGWTVRSSEPIFQTEPLVAVLDRERNHRLLPCTRTGQLTWQTTERVPRDMVARAAAALTDTAGNIGMTVRRYLPDDLYVDDLDAGFRTTAGTWQIPSGGGWGTTSRTCLLGAGDSATARWTPSIAASGPASIFVRNPSVTNPARHVLYRFLEAGVPVDSVMFTNGVPAQQWVYLGTRHLTAGTSHTLEMHVPGRLNTGLTAAADVAKYSALVRDRWIALPEMVDAGEVIAGQPAPRLIAVRNGGIRVGHVTAVSSVLGTVTPAVPLPFAIPPMDTAGLPVSILAPQPGRLVDTLVVGTDDPERPVLRVPLSAAVSTYFAVVDDADSSAYRESGAWFFSVARAYGPTSRYAYPAAGVAATYTVRLGREGLYDILEIVPVTQNASARARYLLGAGGVSVDSAFIDQNTGSGAWVHLMRARLPAGPEVTVRITDAMAPPIPGRVLRADAIRFQWIADGSGVAGDDDGTLPVSYALEQNYPNPANPSTTIRYALPKPGPVSLRVYDLLGREVVRLVGAEQPAGHHSVVWEAGGVASGVYLYRLEAGGRHFTRKILIVK